MRFTNEEITHLLMVASQAKLSDYPDYATQAAILKARSHVIADGEDLYCPPFRVR